MFITRDASRESRLSILDESEEREEKRGKRELNARIEEPNSFLTANFISNETMVGRDPQF